MIAFAVVAAGCGGAEPAQLLETPATPAATTPAETPPGTTVADEPATTNEISKASAKPGEQVKISAITPKRFAKAHCDKVIIVMLYQPGSVLDEALYAQAKLAAKGRRNLVSLAYTPSDVKAYGDLPSKLGLLSTPGLAIIDRSGRIETFWTSYVDYRLIQYQLDRASAARPCKVSSDEVPAAASSPLADAATVAGGGTIAADPAAASAIPGGAPAVDAAGSALPTDQTLAASTASGMPTS